MSVRRKFTRDLYIKLYDVGDEVTKNWLQLEYANIFSLHNIFELTDSRYKQLRLITTPKQNKLLDEVYGTVYNNWYVNINQPKLLLYRTENDGFYGFNGRGEYITKTDTNINLIKTKNLIQATEEQIKTTFLKECEKRGFIKGTKYLMKGRKRVEEIKGTLKVYIKNNNNLQITDGHGGSVYNSSTNYDVEWATIVREKTYKVGQRIRRSVSQNENMIILVPNGDIALVDLQNGYTSFRTVKPNNTNAITKKEIETITYEDFTVIS